MSQWTTRGRCLVLAAGISLALSALIGCSGPKASGSQTIAPGTKPVDAPDSTLAGGSPTLADTIPLADKPATIVYGSAVYTFDVPAADEQKNIGITAGDVPGGILFLTPPGFPDAAAHPIAAWTLWFTPASPTGGSLWNGARKWQTYPKEQSPRLVGLTGGHAIIRLDEGTQVQIVGVRLTDGHSVNIAHHDSSALAGYGHGVYAWEDEHKQVHVVKVATGEQQLIALPVRSSIEIVSAGIMADGKLAESALIDTPIAAAVPAGYKWIGSSPDKPELAVPGNWVVRQLPGGSSLGVEATNPDDPKQKVTMYDNYCGGCSQPGGMAGYRYGSFSSPLLSVDMGETYMWLDEHTVTFTLPADAQNPYPTYGVTRVFDERPGRQWAKVSMPVSNRQTATIILDSMLSRP